MSSDSSLSLIYDFVYGRQTAIIWLVQMVSITDKRVKVGKYEICNSYPGDKLSYCTASEC